MSGSGLRAREGRRSRGRQPGWGLAALPLLALLAFAPGAHAICDVIPGPTNQFRAAVGAADRPFAGPGEFVDVKIRPQVCDKASLGLKDVTTPNGVGPEDVAVTVIFTPPNSGPRHAVVTAADCARFASSVCVGGLSAGNLCTNDLQCLGGSCTGPSKLSACQAQLGAGGAATCIPATGPDLAVTTSATEGHVRFRFPDTDALVGTSSDDRTLAGPATIAVSPPTAPLPCGLASQRCAVTGGTIACVDELYAIDGTCSTQAAALDETFQHFTALPPPNNYEAVCDTPGTPCDGTATEVRFTTDASGNVLIPMDYRGVLVRLDDIPVPRLVRGETNVDAFAGPPLTPVAIPDAPNFLASYSPQGRKVPPLFTPLADPNAPASLTLFGSIDAPLGVIRIARKGPGTLTCSGGANAGSACTSDAQCPAADCALFEFRDRYDVGVGPVVLPDTLYAVGAESPVPIDGLNETADLFAFVRSEALTNEDLNGDGDATDSIATLRDRSTGELQALGAGGSEGRSVVKLRSSPFTFPAIASEGDVLAFLESEPGQGGQDQNGNGSVVDSLLRVYRLGASGATALVGVAPSLTADGSLDMAGGAISLSQGRLYFETRESSLAPRGIELIDVDGDEVQTVYDSGEMTDSWPSVAVSADARFVAFESYADDLTANCPAEGDGPRHTYVRDRQLGTTECISLSSAGVPAAGADSLAPSISADGRFVTFLSSAENLPGSDGVDHIYLRDRQLGTTTWVGDSGPGIPAPAWEPTLSANGRFVTFESNFDLVAEDPTIQEYDVFVHDLQTGVTERISSGECTIPNCGSGGGAVSEDGRFSAFVSNYFDTVAIQDLHLKDRQTGAVERIDLDSSGAPGAYGGSNPSVSQDGRFVAFESGSTLVPGDTNSREDVFVRDRVARTTERVSVSSSGQQGDNGGSLASISADGRFVAFWSDATNLVPDDSNDIPDYFVHDRITGATERVSLAADGTQSDDDGMGYPAITSDGRFVVFPSMAGTLVPGDENGWDVFIRGPIAFSPAADLSGDGDNADRVLRYLDLSQPPPVMPTTLCPIAGTVATAAGRAAFLRDEAASPVSPSCGDNGDADATDRVVHLATGAVVTNLRCAASEVSLSSTRVAALVSESGQGTDLDGNGLLVSSVLHVRGTADTAPSSCAGGWINTALRGTHLELAGDRVALLTPESDGVVAADLNGDGDTNDVVVRLVDGMTGALLPLIDAQGGALAPPAAEDFVLGESILALRTSEASDGGTDRNGDGDTLDAVLQIVTLSTGEILDTGQSVVPCRLEACDPRRPYRVDDSAVSFLTLESQQGAQDLNGDGDAEDLLLQVFNAPAATLVPLPALMLGSVKAGICSTTGRACATDDACSGGTCFVPPGQCELDLATNCSPTAVPPECGSGHYCRPLELSPTVGTCHELQGSCRDETDCVGAAVCRDARQEIQRLAGPLGDAARDEFEPGAQTLPSAGACVEALGNVCAVDEDCPGGAFCDGGTCAREHGPCDEDAACPAGLCRQTLTTATAADQDGDALADPIDNCPTYPNVNQADLDQDGIGDACDAQTCGNGTREGDAATMAGVEECDDGDRVADSICDANCQLVATDCADGFDNDGDGKTDYGTGPTNDPSCQNELAFASESPQCDDGKDNDGDGLVDWPAETKCQNRFDNDELTDPATGCGLLGIEPLIAWAAAGAVTRRRRSGSRAL